MAGKGAMSVVDAIAATIAIVSDNPLVAEAQVPPDLLVRLPTSALKIKPMRSSPNGRLEWTGADALFAIEDLWPSIQQRQSISLTFAQKYGAAWSQLQQSYSTLQVQKLVPEAVIPTKAHPLDSGFDVSVIRIVNPNFGPGVVLFGTGLIIRAPDGYYVDLVVRSSLCKLGWGMANAVGIIDAQYRGELCLPLYKLSPSTRDLPLPARIAQLVVRPLIVIDVAEVEQIGETHRGAGGFGSSGK
jgi:dUTP pyrophosphatase